MNQEPEPDNPRPTVEAAPHPIHRPRRRRMRRLGFAALGLVAAWLLISFAVAFKLTQRKHAPYPEPPPAVAWAKFEGLRLKTADGQEIGGWFADGRENDAPTVLFLHGNGGGRKHCLGRAEILANDLGCALMLISLRAHGDSTGDFNDIGLSARRDVFAAVDFLRSRRPGRPIVVFGVSLGSAAAAFAGGELGDKVDGYVLESPYQDLKTAVRNRTRAALPTPFEQMAYLGLRIAGLFLLPQIDEIAPVEAVAAIPVRVPILIMAGEADELATPEEARAIFGRVASHARLETFPGARHKDLADVDPGRYRRLIVAFAGGTRRIGPP